MIKLKKSNMRSFLVLCAKVAAAEKKEDQELLFLTALKDGVFSVKGEVGGADVKEVAKYCANGCSHLVDLVGSLANLLNSGCEFDIILQGGARFIRTYPGGVNEMPGCVKFQVRPDKESVSNTINRIENPSPVDDDFFFISVFFDSIEEYIRKRNLSLKQVPLRICDWCHNPFFGNRYDQRFCSKIHGQRWHAKQSYEKSK